MKQCSISALAARSEGRWLQNPLVAEGPLRITYSTGQMALAWCASEMSISPPCSASSACTPCVGRRKACGVRVLDAGFHLDVSGTQTADDKMLEPGGWQELPLAFSSTCVTLYRATDYTQVFQWGGHMLQSVSSSGYYLRSQQYQLQDSLIR